MYLTVGIVLLVESLRTLVHAVSHLAGKVHLAGLAAVETVAVLLFLLPRTLRLGGGILAAILLIAAGAHALRGEFPSALLVDAAAVLFIGIQGSTPSPDWTTRSRLDYSRQPSSRQPAIPKRELDQRRRSR